MAAALALGGCELLSDLMGEDAQGAVGTGAEAKGPMPPPAAPRVPRASLRRAANDRGTGDGSPQIPDNSSDGTAVAVPDVVASATPDSRIVTEPPPDAVGDRNSQVRTDLVIGLTEKSLVGWLGEPANRREQSPARIWRYAGAGCTLDVFLFLDLVSREFRALSYEVKGTTNDDQRCLEPVFAGRGSAPRTTASRLD